MDPAIILRLIHDLQTRIIFLEERLTEASKQEVAAPVDVKKDETP